LYEDRKFFDLSSEELGLWVKSKKLEVIFWLILGLLRGFGGFGGNLGEESRFWRFRKCMGAGACILGGREVRCFGSGGEGGIFGRG
jgi:hypothetical protein